MFFIIKFKEKCSDI